MLVGNQQFTEAHGEFGGEDFHLITRMITLYTSGSEFEMSPYQILTEPLNQTQNANLVEFHYPHQQAHLRHCREPTADLVSGFCDFPIELTSAA